VRKFQDVFGNSVSGEEMLYCDLQSPLSAAQKAALIWSNEHVQLCLFALRDALKMSEEKEQRVCANFSVKLGMVLSK